MPSFDIVSEINKPELSNALHQANKELSTRFDFKGTDARVELAENSLSVFADNEFQVQQATDVLCNKLAKRRLELGNFDFQDVQEIGGGKAKQVIVMKEGIEPDLGRTIVKLIKDKKMKVQVAMQGDQLRVTGKKRDDLQTAMAILKESEISLPLQFNNFRD